MAPGPESSTTKKFNTLQFKHNTTRCLWCGYGDVLIINIYIHKSKSPMNRTTWSFGMHWSGDLTLKGGKDEKAHHMLAGFCTKRTVFKVLLFYKDHP
jgi:hypothetical protein